MITFDADGQVVTGYMAVPPQGHGPGVLVLHAWWGLNQFFKDVCDRLAEAGFVALAPDLYQGKLATTVEDAQALLEQRDDTAMEAIASSTLKYLQAHPAVRGEHVGAVGFSLGGAWAISLSAQQPDALAAVVVFYSIGIADFAVAQAAYQGHFVENDVWEPLDGVRQMEADMRTAGCDTTFYIYPNTEHWFMETNRPEYDAEAATLAWQRTIDFLKLHLAGAHHP